jgi:hypothetical protein
MKPFSLVTLEFGKSERGDPARKHCLALMWNGGGGLILAEGRYKKDILPEYRRYKKVFKQITTFDEFPILQQMAKLANAEQK